jgi:hypothetical protein
MSDFLDMYPHWAFAICVVVVMAAFVGFVAFCGPADYRNKLMADCLADGHKQYECVGILRGR